MLMFVVLQFLPCMCEIVWGADDVVLVLCVYVLSLFAYFFSGLILSHSFGIEQDLTTSSLFFFPVKGRI